MTIAHSGALAVMACAIAGCLEGGSGTGGRAVLYELAVEPPASMAADMVASFTTTTGWDVELEEAVVAVGPFYVYENAPELSERGNDELDLLARLHDLAIPTAHAHPGDVHFNGGVLRGEYLGQVAFDLLGGGAASLGIARGIAGDVGSVTVILDPPGEGTLGAVDALHGHHAWVVGTARKDGQTVEFEGGLDLEADGVTRQVDGVPLDDRLDDDGTLVIGVRPQRWFHEAQFDQLEAVADSGRMLITADTQVGIAWRLGLRSPVAYSARWTDEETFPLLPGVQGGAP